MRWLGAIGVIVFAVATAEGHGRPPATIDVHVNPSDPSSLYVGSTFGLLISHDAGCTFYWVCENTVGYASPYDPIYRIGADGTIFAATFGGLRVSRDGGCTFQTATAELAVDDPDRIAGRFAAALDLGPTGEVWVGTGDSGKHDDVYVSNDGGVTFGSAGLPSDTIRWTSLAVAPSDPMRVYVAGVSTAVTHLMRHDGSGWAELPLSTVVASRPLTVAAIDPMNRDLVYVVSSEDASDRLYRSSDGGMTFSEVLVVSGRIHDVVIRPAQVLIATMVPSGPIMVGGPAYVSSDGTSFTSIVGAPQLACLTASPDDSLLGCATNWDPDFMAVTRSSDATSWHKVWRFVELAGPLACPLDTAVTCEQSWDDVHKMYGTTGPACGDHQIDAGVVQLPEDPTPPAGCCESGHDPGPAPVVMAFGVLGSLARRRPARR